VFGVLSRRELNAQEGRQKGRRAMGAKRGGGNCQEGDEKKKKKKKRKEQRASMFQKEGDGIIWGTTMGSRIMHLIEKDLRFRALKIPKTGPENKRRRPQILQMGGGGT